MFQVSKQLNRWFVGPGFVEQCWFGLRLGDQLAMKNWGNGFAIGDANTKIGPIKCLIFQTGEESFTFVTFKTDIS